MQVFEVAKLFRFRSAPAPFLLFFDFDKDRIGGERQVGPGFYVFIQNTFNVRRARRIFTRDVVVQEVR